MKRILFALALVAAACTPVKEEASDLKLWYDEPASQWVEALPVGNGRLGAMVFGGADREQIQLNEETVWAGQPNSNANPDVEEGALDQIRQLIFDGKYRAAQDMVDQKIFFRTNHGMSYQTIGDLYLDFPGHEAPSAYYRDLDISKAVASVKYTVDGVEYVREVISSFADDVVAVNLSASEKGKITFDASLVSPHKKHSVAVEGNDIVLRATTGDQEGLEGKVQFVTRVRIAHDGGKLEALNICIFQYGKLLTESLQCLHVDLRRSLALLAESALGDNLAVGIDHHARTIVLARRICSHAIYSRYITLILNRSGYQQRTPRRNARRRPACNV